MRMFGVTIIVSSSSEVLFDHKFVNFISKKKKFDDSNFNNVYLMQVLASLILSKRVLKSEANREILGLKFGKFQLGFSDQKGVTFVAGTKSDSRQILDLFLFKAINFVHILFGPDVSGIKVSNG